MGIQPWWLLPLGKKGQAWGLWKFVWHLLEQNSVALPGLGFSRASGEGDTCTIKMDLFLVCSEQQPENRMHCALEGTQHGDCLFLSRGVYEPIGALEAVLKFKLNQGICTFPTLFHTWALPNSKLADTV